MTGETLTLDGGLLAGSAAQPGLAARAALACRTRPGGVCPPPSKTGLAALAQLVEHRIRNAEVVGSSPISGTISINIIPYKQIAYVVSMFFLSTYWATYQCGQDDANVRFRRRSGRGDQYNRATPPECSTLSCSPQKRN